MNYLIVTIEYFSYGANDILRKQCGVNDLSTIFVDFNDGMLPNVLKVCHVSKQVSKSVTMLPCELFALPKK